MALIYFPEQGLMGVGVVHPRGRDVVELLTRACLRFRDVDDSRTSGPPKRVICTARMLVRLGRAPRYMSAGDGI
jgi:hypothetical protein